MPEPGKTVSMGFSVQLLGVTGCIFSPAQPQWALGEPDLEKGCAHLSYLQAGERGGHTWDYQAGESCVSSRRHCKALGSLWELG